MAQATGFALIGCGAICRKHITALERVEGARIVAVCDRDPHAARRVGEELGVPHFTDALLMAEREEFDVFSILTPSGTHAEVVLGLMCAGRHFVVEKPLALRLSDADRMIAEAAARDLRVFVVKQNRFNRPMQALRAAVDEGRFGKLVLGTVRVRWSRDQSYYDEKPWRGTLAGGGGVLTNQASHHVDALLWLFGEVESVACETATRLANIEAEDLGLVLLRFTSGALGIIEATTATRPKDMEGSLSVLGEHGAVEIGGFFMNELKTWAFDDDRDDAETWESAASNPDEWAWNHTEFLKDVVHAIRDNRPGPVDALDGRRTLEVIAAAYESAATGRRVSLRPASEPDGPGLPAS